MRYLGATTRNDLTEDAGHEAKLTFLSIIQEAIDDVYSAPEVSEAEFVKFRPALPGRS